MPDSGHGQSLGSQGAAVSSLFGTTHWSVVLNAGEQDSSISSAALEQLCRSYWLPIYAFIRRQRGLPHHDAEEMAQGFFAHLLEHETFRKADPAKGRFRTFLLGALCKFLANEKDARSALKRGGGRAFVSLDEATAEAFFTQEPVQPVAPDKWFDRRWASALVQRALHRLRKEYTEQGRAQLFAVLAPALTEVDIPSVHGKCAAELGMTEGAARVALHRLRRRFGDLLRSEVAQTVSRADEIESELRHLLAAIAS